MVDKIDRPDAPSPYSIKAATETKKDKPKEERSFEEKANYQQSQGNQEWEKFQTDSSLRRTVRVPMEEIEKLIYRRASPRQASPTVDADLIWKNGTVTENVSFLLKQWGDFLKLKNLTPGTPIPSVFWAHGNELEISIPQSRSGSGPWSLAQIEKHNRNLPEDETSLWVRFAEKLGIWDPEMRAVRGSLIVLYFVFLLILVALILTIFEVI